MHEVFQPYCPSLPLPQFLRYVEAEFCLNYALHRRKKGLYDDTTREYLARAFQMWPNAKTAHAMLRFQRDRGHFLRIAQCSIHNFSKLSPAKQEFILSYAVESGIKQEIAHHFRPYLVEYYQELHNAIQSNYNSFCKYIIENSTNGICVVGNANNIKNSKKGSIIDNHNIVIRFNKYVKDEKFSGAKISVLCSNPSIISTHTDFPQWIILSGPNSIFQCRHIVQKKPDILSKVVTVPLHIWRSLVNTLQRPPSAGLTVLALLRHILKPYGEISVAGFLFTADNHTDPSNIASRRHHWQKEKQLFSTWKCGIYDLSENC